MDEVGQKQNSPAPQASQHEFQTTENSAAYLLPKLLLMKESRPQLKLLDVGAGSGTLFVTLAKAIPEGHVTATDSNKELLPRLQAQAELAGVKNIEFQQADPYKLPFADGSFDITHCHQMLCHLKAPWDALREMLRVTRPGGVVAAREGDYETEFIWPDTPGLIKFHKFIAKTLNSGGSSTAGRQLLSWALKTGVDRSQITVSYGTWCFSTLHDRKVWAQAMAERVRAGRSREAGIKSGQTTATDLDEIAKDWEEWMEKDDASLGMMHGEILIQK